MPQRRILKEIGITQEAEDAYFLGLRTDIRPTDPAVVDELVRAGLLQQTPFGTQLLPASTAMRQLLQQREESVTRTRGLLADLLSIENLTYKGFRFTADVDEIRQWYGLVTMQATNILRIFDRPPYLDPHTLSPTMEPLVDKQVTIHTIYRRQEFASEAFLQVVRDSVAHGEVARVAEGLPFRLIVADESEALIMWTTENEPNAFLIANQKVISLLIHLFNDLWKRAFEFRSPTSTTDKIAPELHDILVLLALGLPDAAIAKRLGLSERTIGRRIKHLADTLGVESRFQIGMQAVRFGLI